MSVQLASPPLTTSSLQESAIKKSRKRKHETPDKGRSSSKKRRQAERYEVEDGARHQAEGSSQSKRKKKKKSGDLEPPAEPVTNGTATKEDTELPDAPVSNTSGQIAERPTNNSNGTAPRADVSRETNKDYPFSTDFLESTDPSCFYSTRLSLHVSIPAVSLSTARTSILSMHLAPLLLTYYPPAKGIVVAFSDPVLSARPDFGVCLPVKAPLDGTIPKTMPKEIMSRTADDFGACWVWLTVTFMVFRPAGGDRLHGWANVTSQGFIGLLSYNFFQTAIGKDRIPEKWTWNGPAREREKRKRRKGRLRDAGDSNSQSSTIVEEEASQDTSYPRTYLSDGAGNFIDETGAKVPDTFEFRVVDTDMVPEKDKWALHIDGTLLDEEAERKVQEEERLKFERVQRRGNSTTPGTDVEMSGGLGGSPGESAGAETPQ